MTTISKAIDKQDWEMVAVCLLRGFVQVASKLPPGYSPPPGGVPGRRGRWLEGLTRRRDGPGAFYEEALSQAEKVRLSRARRIQGLDEEIALLRVRLGGLAEEQPENIELLIKGIGMLVRAVSAKYRLSPKSEKDLYQSMLGVLQGVGSVLLPEGFDGE